MTKPAPYFPENLSDWMSLLNDESMAADSSIDWTRQCTRCGEVKPATKEFFPRIRRSPDGLCAWCKPCAAKYWHAWSAANRDARRATSHRRRARVKAAIGAHTSHDIQRQYKVQRGYCYYCKAKVGKKYHVEHAVPLARGGSNGPENIVISCKKCNLAKGNKLPHEWAEGGRLL